VVAIIRGHRIPVPWEIVIGKAGGMIPWPFFPYCFIPVAFTSLLFFPLSSYWSFLVQVGLSYWVSMSLQCFLRLGGSPQFHKAQVFFFAFLNYHIIVVLGVYCDIYQSSYNLSSLNLPLHHSPYPSPPRFKS
jgi:hypothetical protein